MSRVEESDPEGLDYGWVMQVTFVLTVLVGAPLVAALSATRPLPTWESRVTFAVRVGAVVWIVTALSVYLYARRERPGDDPGPDGEVGEGVDPGAGAGDGGDPGGEVGDGVGSESGAPVEGSTGGSDATEGSGEGTRGDAGPGEEGSRTTD